MEVGLFHCGLEAGQVASGTFTKKIDITDLKKLSSVK